MKANLFGKELPLGMAWEANGLRVIDLRKQKQGYRLQATATEWPRGIVEDDHLKDFDHLLEILRQLKREYRWGKRKVVISLPAQSITLRYLKLGVLPPGDLDKAVVDEVKQNFGQGDTTYTHDYMILGEDLSHKDKEQLNVLLAAAPMSLVMDFHDLFTQAGLRLSAIDVAPLALLRALGNDNDEANRQPGILILDIGSSCNQLVAVHQEKLAFSRSFTRIDDQPYQERHEQSDWNDPAASQWLLAEINRTLAYFQVQSREQAGRIVVSGTGLDWAQLDFLQQHLHLDIRFGIPGAGLLLDQYPEPCFATAFGLALKGLVHH